jgi:hypothetical protein
MEFSLPTVLAEWRTAEELAEISDELLDPPGWDAFKRKHVSDGPSGNAVQQGLAAHRVSCGVRQHSPGG